MCPRPSNVIQLQPGQEISLEFRRTVRKFFCGILRNSLKELERYFYTFASIQKYNSLRKCAELYGNRWEKHLCTEEMCGIVRKSVKKPSLYRNARKSDLVEIWFELASQLDLNCSENVKKTIVKSC